MRAVSAGRLVAEQLPRLPPPRPAVVRAQLGEAARALRDIAATELVEPLVRAPDGDRGRDEGNGGQPGDSGSQPRRPVVPLLVREALADTRAVVREAQCGRHAEREREREPGAGSLTRRRGLEVVDEARLRRRPGRDDQPRPGAGDEHQQALEAIATEPEPEHDARRGDGDARPRVRQHEGDRRDVEQDDAAGAHHARIPPAGRQPQAERQRQRRDQGQRVPVADRVPQPRHARAVGEEAREDLAEQRPAEHAEKQHREQSRRRRDGTPAHERPRVQPEHGEARDTRARGSGTPTTGRERSTTRSSIRSRGRRRRTARALTSHAWSESDREETRAASRTPEPVPPARQPDSNPEQAPVTRPVTEEERHYQQRARDAEDRKPCGRSHRSKLAQAPSRTHLYRHLTAGEPCRHGHGRDWHQFLPRDRQAFA